MDDADREEDIHIPTFVEEDVDNYIEQVGKQVISVHEQVCKSSESLYVLVGVTGFLQDNVNSKM